MKEERKEKIIKESRRECELKTRLLANRKGTFDSGVQPSAAHCASAGRAAGAGLPEGLATASAGPPARDAPTPGSGTRPSAPPPRQSQPEQPHV